MFDAVEPDLPGRRFAQAGQEGDGRRFPGAVWSKEPENGAPARGVKLTSRIAATAE